jgi:hypothetical protein
MSKDGWTEVTGYEVGPLPAHLDGAAAKLFGDQFTDDPTWLAIGPRWRPWRRRIARWSFRVDLWLARRFDIGMVYATTLDDQVLAVTLTWLDSPPKLPWWTWLVRAAPIVPGGPIAGWRAASVMAEYAKFEPDVLHANAWVSAADPAFKGAMHQVWRATIARLDELGLPIFIEASWPEYEALYNKYGFAVRDRMTLRTGHQVLGMWRDVGAGDLADLPVRRRAA